MNNERENRNLDAGEMLNKAGFAEFLAKYGDVNLSDSPEDQKTLSNIFEVFNKKDELARDITKVFIESIKAQLGIDITMESGKAKSINEYLDRLAIDEPETLLEYCETVEKYKELKSVSSQLDSTMKGLGGIERVETKFKEKAEQKIGLLSRIGQIFGKGKAIEKQQAQKMMNRVGEAKNAKVNFEEARNQLLTQIASIGGIKDEIIRGANNKLNELIVKSEKDNSTLKDFDNLGAYFKKIKIIEEQNGIEIISYGPFQEGEIEKIIDNGIEIVARKSIEEAVKNHSLGNKTFDNLQKALKPYTERGTMGSKDEQETKTFVLDTLGSLLKEKLDGDPNKDRAKKILLNILLIKLNK